MYEWKTWAFLIWLDFFGRGKIKHQKADESNNNNVHSISNPLQTIASQKMKVKVKRKTFRCWVVDSTTLQDKIEHGLASGTDLDEVLRVIGCNYASPYHNNYCIFPPHYGTEPTHNRR